MDTFIAHGTDISDDTDTFSAGTADTYNHSIDMDTFTAHGTGISDDTDTFSAGTADTYNHSVDTDTFSAGIADSIAIAWWGVAAPL
jgi:hypothetical protein